MSQPQMKYEEVEALLGKEALASAIAKSHLKRKAQAETQITHRGTEIILPAEPEEMTIPEAIKLLKARQEAAEQEYEISEFITGFPFDAAAAFYRVLQNRFGFASSVPYDIETFFGKKEVKPRIMQIKVGPNPGDLIHVPIGGFLLPGFTKPIEVGFSRGRDGRFGLLIQATLKAKDREVIKALIAATNEELRHNSIYKGKALILKTDDDGELQYTVEPEFMRTDTINPESLILPLAIRDLVEVTLFTPIKRTAAVKKIKIPLKRTVALAGPYGTGKTLCAYVTARHCVDNGWTFIMVDKVQGLKAALEFARNFEPAVVFAEDIDRVTENRDEPANDLLNTIDGILAKDSQIMTVLTTNHIEKIQKAMLRPGRMDVVIPIEAPDAAASQQLVRMFAGDLLKKNETLDRLGEAIAGHIPATIREIVERSKLAMISRDANKLNESDLLIAAESMRRHAELISEKKETAVSDEEAYGLALKKLVNGHDVPAKLDKIQDDVEYLRDRI